MKENGPRKSHWKEGQDSPPQLPLPKDVRRIAGNGNCCENIGLWLDHYLPVDQKDWKLTEEARCRKQVFALVQLEQKQISKLIEALNKRHKAVMQWYMSRYGQKTVCEFEARPVWRFVVGLGTAHVLETGITLHRVFGLPIIPASGLKGAARAYAQLYEGKDGSDLEFVNIFGTQKGAGGVVFLDAIPTKIPEFTLDIMNPHYSEYYRRKGAQAPSDWQSPVPIPFLTVSKTPYRFAIVAPVEGGHTLVATAKRWLQGALTDLGVGAKTSANYGYWAIMGSQGRT